MLTPRAPVLVLQPPPPLKLKKKKQSIMGNGVLHSKHPPKKNAPSLSLPPLPFRGWWERSQGGGESYFPLHMHSFIPNPLKFSRNLKVNDGTRGMLSRMTMEQGVCFPACSPQPFHCTPILCFSQVLPTAFPRTQPVNSPRPQLPPRRIPFSPILPLVPPCAGPDLSPCSSPSGGTRGDPALAIPLRVPIPMHPGPSPAGALLSRGAGGEREATESVQEIHRGRESTPRPKRPYLEQLGDTSSVPLVLGLKLYPWEKRRLSAFNSPREEKPASAHTAHTGIRNENPHLAKAENPTESQLPTGERRQPFRRFSSSRSP